MTPQLAETAPLARLSHAGTNEEQGGNLSSADELTNGHHLEGGGHLLRRSLLAALLVGMALVLLAVGSRPASRARLGRAEKASRLYSTEVDELSAEVDGLPGMPFNGVATKSQAEVPEASSSPIITVDTSSDADGPITTPRQSAQMSASGCASNEEKHLGLCYKKCSILTDGKFPHRFAPDGCCQELSVECMLPSEIDVKGLLPGSGYIVSGDGGKPHAPGACEGNEEEYLGICYKRCSLLTGDEYSIRVAPNTCCKEKPCWNIFKVDNLKTMPGKCAGFSIGGGTGSYQCPHKPSVA